MRWLSASSVRRGIAGAALLLFASRVTAQAPDTRPADGQWHFVAGLYGWLPSISGTVTLRDFPSVPIDVPFSDIFSHLKMVLTGHFEGGKEKYGFGLDFMYIRVAAPIPGEVPELLNAQVDLRQFIGEGFGYYRLVRGSGEYPWTLELLGGVRFWDVNTRIEGDLAMNGTTIDWADGFGGLRATVPIGPKVILLGRGDVGAGGAKLDWSASGDVAYRLGKGWVAGLGYRSLNVDYDKAGAAGSERRRFDVAMNGPRVWFVYTW